jgi:hypothetical protein
MAIESWNAWQYGGDTRGYTGVSWTPEESAAAHRAAAGLPPGQPCRDSRCTNGVTWCVGSMGTGYSTRAPSATGSHASSCRRGPSRTRTATAPGYAPADAGRCPQSSWRGRAAISGPRLADIPTCRGVGVTPAGVAAGGRRGTGRRGRRERESGRDPCSWRYSRAGQDGVLPE